MSVINIVKEAELEDFEETELVRRDIDLDTEIFIQSLLIKF